MDGFGIKHTSAYTQGIKAILTSKPHMKSIVAAVGDIQNYALKNPGYLHGMPVKMSTNRNVDKQKCLT